MPEQSYRNHTRYYPPHHFVFYPVVMAGVLFSVWKSRQPDTDTALWLVIAGLFLLLAWLSFLLRQHYALTLQDRLVREEMRLRYHLLTGKDFSAIESRLRFGQIAALRFASDAELPALVDRTLHEQLPASAIKAAITEWRPDHQRV